jgi:hypothetical protein
VDSTSKGRRPRLLHRSGLPDFSWYNTSKREKEYPITIKYTKWPQNIPNDHKINLCNDHKMFQYFQLQDPPKLTQIGIFGLKKMPSGNPGIHRYPTSSIARPPKINPNWDFWFEKNAIWQPWHT